MMTEHTHVKPVASLKEYFRDSVDAAMASNHLVVEQATACYVVNLLTLFSRSDALYEDTDSGYGLKPLAMMLGDAVHAASPDERTFALQRLGDVSLFLAGFFADGLHRAVVGLDYYVNMGGGAYGTLASHVRVTTRGRALAAVFEELSAKFPAMVDVLNEVRESACGQRDRDLLRLYEAWVKTGSRRAARLLREAGVQPIVPAGLQGTTAFRH